MEYKLTSDGGIVRVLDGAFIPADPTNADYAAYKLWVAGGNTPNLVEAPAFAPTAAAYLNTVRATRETILNRLTGIWLAAIEAGDGVASLGAGQARSALLNITTTPSVLAADDIDSLKAAVVLEYKHIVALTPASVRSAFNAVGL